jgi:hypothetical protein
MKSVKAGRPDRKRLKLRWQVEPREGAEELRAKNWGADMGAGNGPTALHRQAQPQFRLKQQQLRLASVTGIGKKNILCPTTWVVQG